MPHMKSEAYPETYHMLSIRSGTLPCSPNSLPMVSKAISTHGSQTHSPVAANVWPQMEFSHPVFLSRLEFLKAAFCTPFFFCFPSMISLTRWKILFISLLMTPPSAVSSVIPQIGKQQLLPSLQIWRKITNWSNTWNMSFNPDKSHTLTMSLRKDRLENPPHPLSQQ